MPFLVTKEELFRRGCCRLRRRRHHQRQNVNLDLRFEGEKIWFC